MPPAPYERDKLGARFTPGGINTMKALDLLVDGEYAYLQNIRGYLSNRITARATQSTPIETTGATVHSIRRLNDTTPAGPPSGFAIISGSGTSVYANSTQEVTGFSGNPVSILPFRPNTSVQPWAYCGDSSPTAQILLPAAFNCAGMVKVRSDGLTRKWGIAEPQTAPTTSFPGGGSGPSQIFYFYTYYAAETGAESNPSPVSIPGTNSQSNPTASVPATAHATNFTFNAAQYEFVGTQIRTVGSVPAGTITDFITVFDMGLPTIPDGVNIDGIQVDLNWVGQVSGTGVLSSVALYYLGSAYGAAKFPGIQNQSFSSDTFQGGSGDTWGAALTPAIVNDPSFGFGVQITTQLAGGTDRSFVNSMAITVYYSTQDANVTPTPSADPQVSNVNWYRQGGGLANPTFVGRSANTATVFNDTLSDLGAATNIELQFDNFEPFPSIDLPRSGVVNVTGQVLTFVSGDPFNLRWLPNTIILLGPANAQLAYSATKRPASTTSWDFTNNDPNVVAIPNGTNVVWNISEPLLAAQPLPSLWGPTDNAAYMFGVYDPLRPNTLYFTKGNNPDSAPDTNQIEVGTAGVPLMNGCIVNGIGMVFSPERAWLIYPTFTTALATVSGVVGQVFNLQESITDRGLYIRSAICTDGGKTVFFRAKDGIYASPGGAGAQSITGAIYNLFPHENHVPVPITIGPYTIFPPDDTKPEKQRLAFATGYIYYDYQDTTATQRTLVYDIQAGGWSVDVYGTLVASHTMAEGQNVNEVYVGGVDGSIRTLVSGGVETATSVVATGANTFGDARAFQRIGDVFVKAFVNAAIAVAIYTEQFAAAVTGYAPTTLPVTNALSPTIIDFTNGLDDDVNDLELILSWATNSTNYLELWQPQYIDLPAITQNASTDWTNNGDDGNKFWQGLILELDTLGELKTFAVEDEFGTLHTPIECPVITSGQTIRSFTFATPFTSHMVRIVTSDGVPWRIYPSGDGVGKWLSQPFPEASMVWKTEGSDNGQNGYQHLFQVNLCYISSQPVTLIATTDQGTFTLTFPATSLPSLLPAKILVKAPRNKWKIISYSLTSSVAFYLWKDQCEFWIKNWSSQDAYLRANPFGGPSSQTAVI